MCWLFSAEESYYQSSGKTFDAYLFQSNYQFRSLFPSLNRYGVTEDKCYLVRSPIYVDEFPFVKRKLSRGNRFYVAKVARADLHKWPKNLFEVLKSVRGKTVVPVLLGFNDKIKAHCGEPPSGSLVFGPGEVPVQDVLAIAQAMYCFNGGARENWPRIGLESMAAGCPVVAPRAWGWVEMIQDRKTGFLCDDEDEAIASLTALACDSRVYSDTVDNARDWIMSSDLTNREKIIEVWWRMMKNLC